jgi:hypothetical protein
VASVFLAGAAERKQLGPGLQVCRCGWRKAAISAENFAMNVPYSRVVLLLAIVSAVMPTLAADTERAIEAIKRGDACGDKSDLGSAVSAYTDANFDVVTSIRSSA